MDTSTVVNQCSSKSESGRRCRLDMGHAPTTNKHGHMFQDRSSIAAPKHITEVLPAGFSLTMERVPQNADLSRTKNRTPEPRDEWQIKVDKDAAKVHAAWERAGGPSAEFATLATKFGGRYVVPPDATESVVAMLRKTTHFGGPLMGKHLSYRKTKHESGNVAVNYVITDKSENVTDPSGRKANGGKK